MPPRPSIAQFLPSQDTGSAQSVGQVSTKGDVYETLEMELGAQHSIKRSCYHHYPHFPDNNQQTFCKKKTVGMEAAVPRNDSKGVSIKSKSTLPLLDTWCVLFYCVGFCLSQVSKLRPPGCATAALSPRAPQSPCTNPVILSLLTPGAVFGFLLVDIQEFLSGSMVSASLKNNYVKAALPRMCLLIYVIQENVPVV